jgi:hypothetical protein
MKTTSEIVRESVERARSRPLYDRRTGKRILRRSEWERLPRWRRWRDIICGWVPPEEYRYHWER